MCSFNIFFGPKWLSSHPNKKARWTSGQFVFKSEGARLALCVCRDTQPYLLSTSDHQMRMTNPDHFPKISHWHQTKTAQSFQKSLTQTNNMICLSCFHLVSCQISPASRRHPTILQMQRRWHVVATNAALVSGMVCNGANALSGMLAFIFAGTTLNSEIDRFTHMTCWIIFVNQAFTSAIS